MADLLDSISGADGEIDALLDAYNEDRLTFERRLDELGALAAKQYGSEALRATWRVGTGPSPHAGTSR
jgi:hypothetical protein